MSIKPYTYESRLGLANALEPNQCFIIPGKALILNAIPLLTQGKALTREYSRNAAKTAVTEVAYTTTKAVLQTIAVENCSCKLAHKFMKDVTNSAVRKVARFDTTTQAATKIMGTAAYASFLGHLAVFIVEEVMLYNDETTATKQTRIEVTKKNGAKLVAGIIGSSVGAGVGTLIKADPGAGLGSMLGGVAAYAIVDQLM